MKKERILRSNMFSIGLRILCLSVSMLTISGCNVHKPSFDCSNGQGMGCGSMIGVHESIKDNSFAKDKDSSKALTQEPVCKSCQKHKQSDNDTTSYANSNSILVQENINTKEQLSNPLIYRSTDKVMRIWFNSYFDETNNFHGEQYIYTVIEPAQWVVDKRESL
ncbi:MAG: type IV conjugative transfer system lipoprotein TraV [Rickettsiales bacterium]|jgi:type IV conjugative transfer system lipoprotein TraV|nr:type IV conjugative transfer system lipoprotein TraV [Rickettsiales bacterium]